MKTFAKANGNLKNCPSLGRGTSNAVAEGVSYVYKGVPLGKASLITVPLTEEGQAVYGGGSSHTFTKEYR